MIQERMEKQRTGVIEIKKVCILANPNTNTSTTRTITIAFLITKIIKNASMSKTFSAQSSVSIKTYFFLGLQTIFINILTVLKLEEKAYHVLFSDFCFENREHEKKYVLLLQIITQRYSISYFVTVLFYIQQHFVFTLLNVSTLFYFIFVVKITQIRFVLFLLFKIIRCTSIMYLLTQKQLILLKYHRQYIRFLLPP